MPLPSEARSLSDKVDSYVSRMSGEQDDFKKAVYAKWLVMLTAGYVEKSLQSIMKTYAENRGNKNVSDFVSRQISRYLSINMDKLREVIGSFSKSWVDDLDAKATISQVEAINSVKTLRDQFAHGSDNGVRWSTATGYWNEVKKLMENVNDIVSQ